MRVCCRSYRKHPSWSRLSNTSRSQHIPRKDNKRADRLCNEVLDGESDSDSPRSTRVSGGRPPQDDDLPVSAKNPALDLDLTRLVRLAVPVVVTPHRHAGITG